MRVRRTTVRTGVDMRMTFGALIDIASDARQCAIAGSALRCANDDCDYDNTQHIYISVDDGSGRLAGFG